MQGSWVRSCQGFIGFLGQDFLKTSELCRKRQGSLLSICFKAQQGFVDLCVSPEVLCFPPEPLSSLLWEAWLHSHHQWTKTKDP